MRLYEYPRTVRLLTEKDFREVFDQVDAKVSCAEITLLARTSKSDTNRLGFIIAKKQIKTAVQRNRVKRHFREQFRIFNVDKKNPVKFDCIVLARKACQNLDDPKLNETINWLLKRLCKRIEQSSKSA